MTFNSNKDWRDRLEEMDETALDDRNGSGPGMRLSCNTCGRKKSGRECDNCGHLSW